MLEDVTMRVELGSDLGLVHARQKRPDHPEARPHLGDELVGRGGVDNFSGAEMHRFAGLVVLAGPFAVGALVNAVIVQNAFQHLHVNQPGQVVQRQRLRLHHADDEALHAADDHGGWLTAKCKLNAASHAHVAAICQA